MDKKALIIGANGQDGILLNYFLTKKNYIIYNVSSSPNNTLVNFFQFDLSKKNYQELNNFILQIKPNEIYYLAAFHHPSTDKSNNNIDFISKSYEVNLNSYINILELIKNNLPSTKVVYTSSSLIFAGNETQIFNESVCSKPNCIYSLTKKAAQEVSNYYATNFNCFTSIGIMFNHESIYRKNYFLSKKIVVEVKQLIKGKISNIIVGDLRAVTDWGYALDYVEALWLILQQNQPSTYIISSNEGKCVKDWFLVLENYLNKNILDKVIEDKNLIQRKKPLLIGNNSKIKAIGWMPKVSFAQMVVKMYTNEI